ncbi:MAG TPA: hypothetical protein VGG10_02360 [Rhizomicrobium sp.]|jgi:Ca2+-binding RTX toxin-like protein
MANFTGTSGDDTFSGTGGADTFDLSQGGNDTAFGRGGKDVFILGGALTAADHIDGGDGDDTVVLDGNYQSGLALAATTLVNVETIKLTATFDYNLKTDDATVAAGQTLTVDGSTLGATDKLTFNGASETDGSFVVYGGLDADKLIGGALDDVISGGGGNDIINLSYGGNDRASGGDGNDTFMMGAAFTKADQINGGAGTDTVVLNGDYGLQVGLRFDLKNVEVLQLDGGHSYRLFPDAGTVASDAKFEIDGSRLGAADSVKVDADALTKGTFEFVGGAGDDSVVGGSGINIFDLRNGGSDVANSGHGFTEFLLGGAFSEGDQLIGNSDFPNCIVVLDGDYSSGLTITKEMASSIADLQLDSGHDYDIAFDQSIGTSSGFRAIDATRLGASDNLTLDLTSEQSGNTNHQATSAVEVYLGKGNNVIYAGLGADIYLNGGGHDTFVYSNPDQSTTGSNLFVDQIKFISGLDHFQLGVSITGIDPTLHGGFQPSTLQAHHAVLVDAEDNNSYLFVDANGVAGYQEGQDYVFQILDPRGTYTPSVSDFT